MKGQRLFVRFTHREDADELASFYENEEAPDVWKGSAATIESGLIGKVVGEIVAHLSFSRTAGAIRIEHLYVARSLRRKRIAKFMVSELERLAADPETRRIDIHAECATADFFRRIGFTDSSDGKLLTRGR